MKRKTKLPAPWANLEHQFLPGDVVLLDGWQKVLIVGFEDAARKLAVVVSAGNPAIAMARRIVPMDRVTTGESAWTGSRVRARRR